MTAEAFGRTTSEVFVGWEGRRSPLGRIRRHHRPRGIKTALEAGGEPSPRRKRTWRHLRGAGDVADAVGWLAELPGVVGAVVIALTAVLLIVLLLPAVVSALVWVLGLLIESLLLAVDALGIAQHLADDGERAWPLSTGSMPRPLWRSLTEDRRAVAAGPRCG